MAAQLQLASVKYKRNSYIIVEGKPAVDQFFILREGKVQVFREVEVAEEEGNNVLGAGDVFGVVSAMSSRSCIESAMAVTDVTLIAVRRDQYGDLIRLNTPVAMKIIRQFSQRLRYLDDALSRQGQSSKPKDEGSPLFNSAVYYDRTRRYSHAYYAYQQYLKYEPNSDKAAQVRERLQKIAIHAETVNPIRQGINDAERVYPRDSMIFAEGERGDELYIIKKGTVKITKVTEQQEVILAILKPGDIFGEMALLEDKPRMAAAVVYEECTLMVVNRANFGGLIAVQPQLVTRLTTLFAERLWVTYKQLANTLIENPLGRIYDALLIQLEKDRVATNTNESHLCNFGLKELVGMARLPPQEADQILKRVLLSKRVTMVGDKIYVADASDVVRQAEYYRRAQKMGISRGDAAKSPAN
jgi:CRP-like cAMP-binding protein